MRNVTKALIATAVCAGSLAAAAPWISRGCARAGVYAGGPDVFWRVADARSQVMVSLRLNERDQQIVEVTATDIVAPATLAAAVGLRLPDGWVEANGPPYVRLNDGTPIPAPPGWLHFKGSLALSRSEDKRLVLSLDHPERATGVIEIRYQGGSDVCPLAGSVRVLVGSGPALAGPAVPFPADPLLEFIPLC